MFLNHYCILVGICLAIVNHVAGIPKQKNYQQEYLNELLDSYEGELPSEVLEFAPHQNNKHQNLNNAQQYRNFKVSDDGYRNDNIFQKAKSYDEKLIDELIDEYLKENNYDDSSRNENGASNSRASEIVSNLKPKNKEDEEIVRIVQTMEQAPATEPLKTTTESNAEKAKIENGGQLNSPNPSNKLVDKNIDKDGQGTIESLKNDKNNAIDKSKTRSDYYLVYVLIAACGIAALLAVMATGMCWYSINRNTKANQFADYPAFSSSSKDPTKISTTSNGDRRLAQSAQMYHYQHQKQQMIAMEKAHNETKNDASDNSDAETEEGDYTVYECPGLAQAGEMEVKNPLFLEELAAADSYIHSASVNETQVTNVSNQANVSTTSASSEEAAGQQQKSDLNHSSLISVTNSADLLH